jgi:hypothetical protein
LPSFFPKKWRKMAGAVVARGLCRRAETLIADIWGSPSPSVTSELSVDNRFEWRRDKHHVGNPHEARKDPHQAVGANDISPSWVAFSEVSPSAR